MAEDSKRPGYVIQQLRRRQPGQGRRPRKSPAFWRPRQPAASPAAGDDTPDKRRRKHRDWSMDLGLGGPTPNTFPAKWSFDTTGANCASDFVVILPRRKARPAIP